MTARIIYSTSLSNHNIAHILKLLTTNQMGGPITVILGPVHTTPGAEFENGGFTLKVRQTFSIHTMLEEFKNATITSHFAFVFV